MMNACASPPQCYSFSLPVSFICLRFERVDNLGAFSIPSETGLLIPSVHDSYHRLGARNRLNYGVNNANATLKMHAPMRNLAKFTIAGVG